MLQHTSSPTSSHIQSQQLAWFFLVLGLWGYEFVLEGLAHFLTWPDSSWRLREGKKCVLTATHPHTPKRGNGEHMLLAVGVERVGVAALACDVSLQPYTSSLSRVRWELPLSLWQPPHSAHSHNPFQRNRKGCLNAVVALLSCECLASSCTLGPLFLRSSPPPCEIYFTLCVILLCATGLLPLSHTRHLQWNVRDRVCVFRPASHVIFSACFRFIISFIGSLLVWDWVCVS